MSSAENEPRALWSRVAQAGGRLRASSLEQRAAAIANVARTLASTQDERLLDTLAQSAGLSRANVRWALRTTFETFSFDALLALASTRAHAAPESAVAVVLAGNVFTAAARPMLLPLLVGAPVLAKASSRDDALPFAIARMLSDEDALLGAACGVVSFAHDEHDKLDALLAGASSVHVLGSDQAVAAVRVRRGREARFVGRGHGLGMGLVATSALASEERARDAARAFAQDVAAYDQRGCLSPHAVIVEEHAGAALRASDFARLLSEALSAIASERPRGDLPQHAAAEQLQWRGVAAARGELHVGAQHAVSYEHAAPIRPSPGYRNIGVYALSEQSVRERVAGYAFALKAFGVAGSAHEVGKLAPYVCAAGQMQTPPLHAALDGLHPLTGLGS